MTDSEDSVELPDTTAIDDSARILHIDTDSVKCFLCNKSFNTGDKTFLIFNERVQSDGTFDCPLSHILSSALDIELEESAAHSTLLCNNCNLHVLAFEKLERKIFEMRTRILDAYDKTTKHLEMLRNEAKYKVKLVDNNGLFMEVQNAAAEEEILGLYPEYNGAVIDEHMANLSTLKSAETVAAANPVFEEINEESVIIYDDSQDCEDTVHEEGEPIFEEVQVLNEVAKNVYAANKVEDLHSTMSSHNEKIFSCELCGNVFENEQDLGQHFAAQHVQSAENFHFECETCNIGFETNLALLEHISSHHPQNSHICEVCLKCFATTYSLQMHKKTHGSRERPFHCDQCDKEFLTHQNLQQHKKVHTKERLFACEVCKKTFVTQHNLDAHGIIHSGLRPYHCKTCSKSFARKAEMIDHERIHSGIRPFKCDLCELSFTQRSNLTAHKKVTHFNEKLHKCDLCDRSFKRRRLLEYHKNAAHTGERPYKCDKCSSSFVYKEHYKKHLIIHTGKKPYACEVCNKCFNSRDNRNAHRFVHSDKKPYECVDCGAGFMRKPLLLIHMKQSLHINDTIIVNQPQMNGGILQTTTLIVPSAEETMVDEPQEMLVDNFEDTSRTYETEIATTSSSPIGQEFIKTEKVADTEMYNSIVKIDDFVVSWQDIGDEKL